MPTDQNNPSSSLSNKSITFLGLTFILAWIQMTGYLCLTRDSVVYNASFLPGTLVIVSLVLCGFASFRFNFEVGKRGQLLLALVISVTTFLYHFVQESSLCLLLFCLQITCALPFLITWMKRLSLFSPAILISWISLSGAVAEILFSLYCWEIVPYFWILKALLPVFSSLCLYLSYVPLQHQNSALPDSPNQTPPVANNPTVTSFFNLVKKLPWLFLGPLCFFHFSASFFIGLVTKPFAINSMTIFRYAFILEIAILLFVVLVSFFLERKRRKKISQNLGGSSSVNNRLSSPNKTILLRQSENINVEAMTQAFFGVTVLLLVAGLLLFASKLPHSMTLSLGMVFAAQYCLMILCLISIPPLLNTSKKSFVPLCSLMTLCSGILYAEFLGSWMSKPINLGFESLVLIAIFFIAAIAIACMVYVIGRTRQDDSEKTTEEASSPQENLSIKDLQGVLKQHQVDMLSSYGLTEREEEVILLIFDGQTFSTIAEKLFLSERTIKFHSKNAYQKIGVHNRKELMQKFSALSSSEHSYQEVLP